MEYFWLIVAALGAGIGTGLAGLSAATVMVPIMIVMCPGFSGETGAYQATAIALASDILGSAVTTVTYARHKNIDLKRGWIMLACIVTMCTAGSYVAWLAGNVVLGSFTLFLTFFIGIRFLIKPDTTKAETVDKGEGLGLKGVVISLFFGLTIGFGTGFVGTGGGMMMLVVFTAFLGMDLKTGVGTSTFIMTFTALIASVSHILIHPAIVLEKWPELVIAIIVATVSSLVSAQFANRVKNRTIGLVTGAFLTVLGAAMLILHYWDFLSQSVLFVDTLQCLGRLVMYIVPCVAVLLLIYFFTGVKKFVFRKLLHIVAFTCVTLMIMSAGSWAAASIASVVVAAVIYPVLAILEKESWYADLFVEKKPGEIKTSLLMLFLMFAVLNTVAWGIFKRPEIGAAAILMWGVGDAAAALVGIPFGRHKVQLKGTDGHKSWEGTAAMFAASSLCGILFLLLYGSGAAETVAVADTLSAGTAMGALGSAAGTAGGMEFWRVLVCGLLGGAVGAAVELFSPSEWDTVTVPMAVLAVLLAVCML